MMATISKHVPLHCRPCLNIPLVQMAHVTSKSTTSMPYVPPRPAAQFVWRHGEGNMAPNWKTETYFAP
jgi:hypothetical protein